MGAFTPRLTCPEAGNPYYNTKANGGYSDAIKGSPEEPGLDVLRNCVGYAFGRFNEIAGQGKMVYLAPVNAENFIEYRNYRTKGLTYGWEPKLGACAVWQAGKTKDGKDGAGHVAGVEVINGPNSIVTSESGYDSKAPFWTRTRTNDDGNWGQPSSYKFLGFIYNPAVPDLRYRKNDVVYFTGHCIFRTPERISPMAQAPALMRVIDTAPGAKHPYQVRRIDGSGSFVAGSRTGWADEIDILT